MAKPGIIEEAEGGTLFLDEIGEMAPELQTKLLRFTQDRMLVAGRRRARAPHRHAHHRGDQPHRRRRPKSGSGGLRADLAARLGAEAIRIPPLRERIEDLGALARYLLGDADEAVRAGGVPGAVPLRLAGQRARARQGRDVGGGAGARRGAHRLRAPARGDRRGAARCARRPGARKSRPPPSAAELEALMRRFQRQHDARRARARPQAGAGLPLGEALRLDGGRLSAQGRDDGSADGDDDGVSAGAPWLAQTDTCGRASDRWLRNRNRE